MRIEIITFKRLSILFMTCWMGALFPLSLVSKFRVFPNFLKYMRPLPTQPEMIACGELCVLEKRHVSLEMGTVLPLGAPDLPSAVVLTS